MNKELIEAGKELLRVVLLAVIPIVIVGTEQGSLNPRVVAVVALVAGLKFIDKLLHKIGKEASTKKVEDWRIKGLTRF